MHKSWRSKSDPLIIAEQAYSHVPRVLILDRISRRVYESLHLDEFNHQIEDGIWEETTVIEKNDNQLEIKTEVDGLDLVDSHTTQLIMLIEQFTDELHPLRHSNSYKFLKKKFKV